jgi:large repetitive protein
MLRELRCADSLNKTYYDNYFTDKQLWEMATLNAAAVTATDDVIGLLAPNHVADIAIFKSKGGAANAFRNIIDADPQDVALVLRGGKALYGDDAPIAALASDCDTVDVCGSGKRVCLKSEIGKTWTELQAAVGTIYPAFFCQVPDKEPSCTPKRPGAVNGSTIYTGVVAAGSDSDGDGIPDGADNCPEVFNPVRPMDNGTQPDADGDAAGDACDVCPADPNTDACSPVNPDDRDHATIVNSADNCPDVANPGQTDGDTDGHGDACDPCPSNANPGTAGCPATIYAIKQGQVSTGTVVRVQNALVTGKGTNGFFVQTKMGDAGYAGSDFSGLFVYTGAMAPTLANAVVGLRVTVDGTVTNFQGQLELDTVASVTPTTLIGEAAPDPVSTTYAQIKTGGTKAAALESVLVSVGAANVTAVNATFGEYTLTSGADTLIVDDYLYVTPPTGSAVGTAYTQVIGILALRQQASKLEPRSGNDLIQGAPTLAAFGPTQSYVRAAQNGVNTFPAGSELTVTLSGPAQGDTDVTVTSPSGDLVVVGGKVTVPNGQTSARVVVNGVNQNANVTLTAQLGGGTPLNAQVRVLSANEQPTSVTITPASVAVGPAGTAQLTVTLNIPAPPGGFPVSLSVSPGGAGTTNPATTVTVAADAQSASLTYTDASGTAATVSATFSGGNTSNTAITISAGAGHLVINEIDYDNTGPVSPNDNAEYIEIYNPTGSAVSLANVALVLINGSLQEAYPMPDSIMDLSSAGSIPAGGYLVVAGQSLTVPASALKFEPGWTVDGIQNGSPDGVALVDTSTNTLIDALSYEGSITAADVPGIANPVSLVEGTALSTQVADSNTVLGALCRSPNGRDTDVASADWKFCTSLTPGTANP